MTAGVSLRRIASALIALLSLTLAAPANAGIDWASILEGEILVESATSENGLEGVRAVFAVTASRERIWEVLTDYENFKNVFPRIEEMIVLEEDGTGATIEFWGDALVTELHYVLRRSYVEPGYRLTWRRISGDLKRIEGSWRIVEGPEPGVYALVYESFVDVGFAIVTWIVRLGALNEARNMAARLRAWIEAQP
jgi:hypothetical protein